MAPYSGNSKPYARAGLVMIGLAWTLPFLQPFHRFPLPGFYSEWLAFALGLAGTLVLLRREPSAEMEIPAVAAAPLAYALVLGVQVSLGLVTYAAQAWTASLYLLWAALLIALGQRLRRELGMEEVVATLAWCALAGGVLSAAAGLLQHYQAPAVPAWLVSSKVTPEVYGNLGQSNHYATYLVVALAGALYLYGRGRLAGGWMAACAVLILPPLALSGSRSTWLYLAVLAALAAMLWHADRGPAARRLGIATICLLPGLAVAHGLVMLSLAAPPSSALPAVTSVERIFHVATGASLRMQLWEGAWRMFLDAPVLGVGFGQFAWHHFLQAAGDPSMDPRVYRHAHNLPAQLLAETGVIGTLVVAGPLGAWLAALRRLRLDLEWTWLLGLLALVGIHSLLEFPLWYAYFLGIAALLLGIGSRPGLTVRGSAAARSLLAIVIAWGGFNLAAVLAPYRQFERLFFLPGRDAAAPDERAFAAAMASLHREPALVPYVELALAFGLRVDEDHLVEKLRLAERAAHFAPVPVVSARYAMLLALAGEREQALTQLGRTLRAYPADAPRLAAELENLAYRYPLHFRSLLELARGVARVPRRSGP